MKKECKYNPQTLAKSYEIYTKLFGEPKTHEEWAERFNKVGEINRILNKMSIETYNDGKEKYQSWEATFEQSGSTPMGHYNSDFMGYGKTEEEAKLNLVEQVDNLIKNLKRIKDGI
jgi:hypothetical protein